jgi:hypothetical protein
MKAIDRAYKLILRELAAGPKRSTEVFGAAEREGISRSTLKRAARDWIGVRARKTWGGDNHWTWELPPPGVCTARVFFEAVRDL